MPLIRKMLLYHVQSFSHQHAKAQNTTPSTAALVAFHANVFIRAGQKRRLKTEHYLAGYSWLKKKKDKENKSLIAYCQENSGYNQHRTKATYVIEVVFRCGREVGIRVSADFHLCHRERECDMQG